GRGRLPGGRRERRGHAERGVVVEPDVAEVRGEHAAALVGVLDDAVLIGRLLVVLSAFTGEQHGVVCVERALIAPQRVFLRRVGVDDRAAGAVGRHVAAVIELHAAGRLRHAAAVQVRIDELRVGDAHLAQHALHDVDVAGVDGEARNVVVLVELVLLAREARLRGGARVVDARRDRHGDHAPPLAELDDHGDRGAGGRIGQHELAVDAGGGLHDRRLQRRALVAGGAGGDRLDRARRHEHDRVVDRIGVAEVLRRIGRRYHGAADGGHAAVALVRAGGGALAAHVRRDHAAQLAHHAAAAAARDQAAAAVAGHAAVEAELSAGFGRAARRAAHVRDAAAAAGLARDHAAAAVLDLAAAVAGHAAVVAERHAARRHAGRRAAHVRLAAAAARLAHRAGHAAVEHAAAAVAGGAAVEAEAGAGQLGASRRAALERNAA